MIKLTKNMQNRKNMAVIRIKTMVQWYREVVDATAHSFHSPLTDTTAHNAAVFVFIGVICKNLK